MPGEGRWKYGWRTGGRVQPGTMPVREKVRPAELWANRSFAFRARTRSFFNRSSSCGAVICALLLLMLHCSITYCCTVACFTAELLHCFTAELLHCCTVALLLCFTASLLHCFTVTLFQCYCCTIALLHCYTVDVAMFLC